MIHVPRKLKKEIKKLEIHAYPCNRRIRSVVVILPEFKVNKWTIKLFYKVKAQLKRADSEMEKRVVRDFIGKFES